jgi:hypothetical protein
VRALPANSAQERMKRPVPVALPWYDRRDYAALLAMFVDPENLPDNFDAWLKHAENVERQLQAAGFTVVRMSIRPKPFAAWCETRGIPLDQRARLSFANEAARALDVQERPSDG